MPRSPTSIKQDTFQESSMQSTHQKGKMANDIKNHNLRLPSMKTHEPHKTVFTVRRMKNLKVIWKTKYVTPARFGKGKIGMQH